VEKFEVLSTSSQSAICSDIVIRETDRIRLVFRPEIIDNPHDPAAAIKGRFLYQRKAKKGTWEAFETIPLSSIKHGEGFQLEIKSGELLPLLHELAALYRFHQIEGIPQGRIELVKIQQQFAHLLRLGDAELNGFFAANPGDALITLRRVLHWIAGSPSAARRFAEETAPLPELNALVGLTNLRAVHSIWRDNSENDDEEFWQQTLAQHSFVLSQMLAYPVVVIRGKAYVGGKRVDNAHGNLVDFLGRIPSSGAAVLMEIKTPQTALMGKEYRQDVYPPSSDVTGAISQVLEYRETLLQEMHQVLQGQSTGITPCDPKCVVIIGSAHRDLSSESRKRSFERFRERLVGVTIVTFDEVFERVSKLISLFNEP
jgi:hypothetical protein